MGDSGAEKAWRRLQKKVVLCYKLKDMWGKGCRGSKEGSSWKPLGGAWSPKHLDFELLLLELGMNDFYCSVMRNQCTFPPKFSNQVWMFQGLLLKTLGLDGTQGYPDGDLCRSVSGTGLGKRYIQRHWFKDGSQDQENIVESLLLKHETLREELGIQDP